MDARGFWRPWKAARRQSDYVLPRVTEVTWRPTRTHRSLPTLLEAPQPPAPSTWLDALRDISALY